RGRLADQHERPCKRHPLGDAGSRRAYRGGAARRRLQRCRYRRHAPERSVVMDAITGNAPPREYAGGKMLAAKDRGIGFITFNQPEKRNAMSVEMWQGLAENLDDFREDAGVRVVIMTGAGGKAFVSGADISQFEKRRANADAQEEYARLTNEGRARLADFPKPKIAAIQGFCLGGGLAIAMQ